MIHFLYTYTHIMHIISLTNSSSYNRYN